MCILIQCKVPSFGIFTLSDSHADSDSDSDSDFKPNGYTVLCRTFRTTQSQIRDSNLEEWNKNRNPDL